MIITDTTRRAPPPNTDHAISADSPSCDEENGASAHGTRLQCHRPSNVQSGTPRRVRRVARGEHSSEGHGWADERPSHAWGHRRACDEHRTHTPLPQPQAALAVRARVMASPQCGVSAMGSSQGHQGHQESSWQLSIRAIKSTYESCGARSAITHPVADQGTSPTHAELNQQSLLASRTRVPSPRPPSEAS